MSFSFFWGWALSIADRDLESLLIGRRNRECNVVPEIWFPVKLK